MIKHIIMSVQDNVPASNLKQEIQVDDCQCMEKMLNRYSVSQIEQENWILVRKATAAGKNGLANGEK